ncbi:MAG: hypothetical protein IJ326_12065 [Lachnospiraceae bacterium]|nr:hypothetical protein [Lachnospiraceae bacterium]
MKKASVMVSLILLCLCVACGNSSNQIVEETKEVEESLTEVDTPQEEPIELVVCSQLSSYDGVQGGWFAQVMQEKFNVKLIISPYLDVEKGLEQGFLGDIIVFGNTGDSYKTAVEEGVLLDWEANDLLAEHGSYILENMPKALEHNRSLVPQKDKIFGFGNNVASSNDTFEEVIYTWDIRWDLYKELGYPTVKDLDELTTLFEDMKKICPTDDSGEETYAMSIWPDWDTNMVMCVKAMASAYYGYDEFHFGLYDSDTGAFYGALDENGPYLEMLKYFNTLYRKGLLDPNSKTQTYEDMLKKLQSSGLFFSVMGYCGSLAYNTEGHIAENKYMASLLPEDATPATYGMSVTGGNRVWTIGADTQNPELCMQIINWLCTPEGRLTYEYGPQGVMWDYDEEGNTYFTELGKTCYEDRVTLLTGDYEGYFSDGCPQINNITWSYNAENPESNGETYNAHNWKSNAPSASCEMEQDWRDYTGTLTTLAYMKTKNCVVVPAINYEAPEKREALQKVWDQVANCIVTESWNAIYAESDEEYEKIVSKMVAGARACGYEQCMTWCKQEAERRRALEEDVR